MKQKLRVDTMVDRELRAGSIDGQGVVAIAPFDSVICARTEKSCTRN